MPKKKEFDVDAYKQSVQEECFICNIISHGERRTEHPILFEDESHIAFLNKYPTQPGQSLVAPKKHLRHIFSDFDEDQY